MVELTLELELDSSSPERKSVQSLIAALSDEPLAPLATVNNFST